MRQPTQNNHVTFRPRTKYLRWADSIVPSLGQLHGITSRMNHGTLCFASPGEGAKPGGHRRDERHRQCRVSRFFICDLFPSSFTTDDPELAEEMPDPVCFEKIPQAFSDDGSLGFFPLHLMLAHIVLIVATPIVLNGYHRTTHNRSYHPNPIKIFVTSLFPHFSGTGGWLFSYIPHNLYTVLPYWILHIVFQ